MICMDSRSFYTCKQTDGHMDEVLVFQHNE